MESQFLFLDPRSIQTSDINIRKTPNPAQHEIYTSIKASKGANIVLYVSKQEDSDTWVVVHGGGSRLQALQKLANQHSDNASENHYEKVHCIPVPWDSTSSFVLSGLRENLCRGDTSFAENCSAVQTIRSEWQESDLTVSNTDQEFVTYLNNQGLKVSLTAYRRMKTCAELLLPHAPIWLYQGRAKAEYIKQIIDNRSAVSKVLSSPPDWLQLSVTYSGKDAKTLYDKHLAEALRSMDNEELQTKQLIAAISSRLAKGNGVDPKNFKLAVLNKVPVASIANNGTYDLVSQSLRHGEDPTDIADQLGVTNSFAGGLRLLLDLSPRDFKNLQSLLSNTLFKEEDNEPSERQQTATS